MSGRKPQFSNPYLILRDGLGAVSAAHILDVAPAVLVAAMVPPLRGHLLEIELVEAVILKSVILREVDTHKYNVFLSFVRTQFPLSEWGEK